MPTTLRGVHPAWIVIAAGVSAALHVGKLPPALPVLQASLQVGLLQAGFLLSLVQLAGMSLGLLVGLSVDAVGLRRSMLMGVAVQVLASAAGGFAMDVITLMALRALEGLGFLWVVMPAPALIRRSVNAQQLPAYMGWWGTYMPIGSALALLLGPLVMAVSGWPQWWGALSVTSALAWLALWWGVAQDPPAGGRQTAAPTGSWPARLRLTLRTPGVWWVSLGFAAYSSQWLAVIGFLPTVYAHMGMQAGLNGVLTATVALANVSGNVMSGRLLQRGWPAWRLLCGGFAGMGLGAVLAFVQVDGWQLPLPLRFAAVVVFSAVGGLIPGTLFSMAVRLAPSESTVSTTVGWIQQWSAFGQFAGPPLVAAVAAQLGGWQWTWCVTLTLCAVGLLLAWRIQRELEVQTA